MNLLTTAPDALLWLLIAAVSAAAIQDAVQLRISNLITLAVLILAIVAAFMVGIEVAVWQNLLVFGLVLAVGTVLFSRGVLGGGDVKLLAAVGLWADLGGAARLIASIFIFGGLLALLIVLGRTVLPASLGERVAVLKPKAGIPYGIAIALGTVFIVMVSKPEAPAVYVPEGITIRPR